MKETREVEHHGSYHADRTQKGMAAIQDYHIPRPKEAELEPEQDAGPKLEQPE